MRPPSTLMPLPAGLEIARGRRDVAVAEPLPDLVQAVGSVRRAVWPVPAGVEHFSQAGGDRHVRPPLLPQQLLPDRVQGCLSQIGLKRTDAARLERLDSLKRTKQGFLRRGPEWRANSRSRASWSPDRAGSIRCRIDSTSAERSGGRSWYISCACRRQEDSTAAGARCPFRSDEAAHRVSSKRCPFDSHDAIGTGRGG